MKNIKEKIDQLPPELQEEVGDFINYLLDKYNGKKKNKLSQSWAGSLKEFKNKYTSIELEKKANKWRSE